MKYYLSPFNVYEDEDYIWCSENAFNGVYRIEKKRMIPEFMFHFPNEPLEKSCLYTNIIKVKDRFIFTPCFSNHITIYNEKIKEICSLPLKEMEGKEDTKFNMTFLYGDFVYFIPLTYRYILKLDLNTNKIEYLDDWYNSVLKNCENYMYGNEKNFFYEGVQIEDTIYLPLCMSNHILVFNLSDDTYRLIEIKNTTDSFCGICFDGKDFLLSPTYGSQITKWNQDQGIIGNISFKDFNEPLWFPFSSPIIEGGLIYFFQLAHNMSYVMKISENEPKELDILDKDNATYFPVLTNPLLMNFVSFKEKKLKFINQFNHRWYSADLEKGKKTFIRFQVEIDIISDLTKGNYFFEEIDGQLECFVEYLSRIGEHKKEEYNNTIGKAILKHSAYND